MGVSQGAIGYGVAVDFGTTGGTYEVLSVRDSLTREPVDFTHAASPNRSKEYKPGLADTRQWDVDIIYRKGEYSTLYDATIADEEEITFTIPNPGGTDETIPFTGFITNLGTEIPVEDKMTRTISIKESSRPDAAE